MTATAIYYTKARIITVYVSDEVDAADRTLLITDAFMCAVVCREAIKMTYMNMMTLKEKHHNNVNLKTCTRGTFGPPPKVTKM